ALFDPALAQRPQVVAVNKVDLPEVQGRLPEIKEAFSQVGIKASYISAATGQGVSGLMAEALGQLKSTVTASTTAGEEGKVFRPQPREAGVTVRREGEAFVLSAPGVERLMVGDGMGTGELRWQLQRQLARLGVTKALERAGAKPGDKIRCGDLEWEW
ncbi:Obg family GTPase CgtA, partial [Chloroflexota bacterium]